MGRDVGTSEQRSPEDLLGTVLGTCTLERILGRGGMGIVYLAQQSRPHRQVAVKVLLLSLMPDPDRRARFLQRFRREADAVAALDHPNILPIYEYGEQGDLAYLVMPYVTGGTLRDRVERKGQLPFAEIAGFLTQVASALDYAHSHGVIHRDVKPQNMLLYPDKRLLLSDFGIAKVAEQAAADPDEPTAPQLTTMGHVVGTPDYIAPEQAMGQQVDGRADIYSLGVVLFYLVTGRVPFVGPQPMTVAAKHVSEPPPPPRQFRPDLPPAAEQVMLKALAKDPAARYGTAGEFARAFRAAAVPKATVPVSPAPPARATSPAQPPQYPATPPAPPKKPSAGRPWLALGTALLLLILAAGATYTVIANSQRPTGSETPTATTAPTNTPIPTTPTSTPTSTPTQGVTPTPTPPPVTRYQASQFLPQQGDLPANTSQTSPQTADTKDEFEALNLPLVEDPTSGKYNWQQEVYFEVHHEEGNTPYFNVAIAQFEQAGDAQKYYDDVLPHLTDRQTQQIGQQATAGLCCDGNNDYNVVFRDQNVVVIILLVEDPTDQGKLDALNLASKMDQHARQALALRPDLWLADLPQRRAAAA